MHPLQAPTRSALGNARAAASALAREVSDRRAGAPVDGGTEALDDVLRLIDEDTCWTLLASRTVGRLAYLAREGTPDVVPVNHLVEGRTLLLRSGPGPKLQAAVRRELVALQVDDLDEEQHTGWSVVVVGRAGRVSAYDAQRLPVPQPWAAGPRSALVRITPGRVSGRRLG